MSNIGHNIREMERLGEYLRDGLKDRAIRTMQLIHRGTVTRFGDSPGTPVDTGEARSGGRVSLNNRSTFEPPPEAPAYPVYGEDEVERDLSGFQPGDTPIWSNNVPYSALLDGSAPGAKDPAPRSKQAPQGFVQQSIEAAGKVIEDEEYDP